MADYAYSRELKHPGKPVDFDLSRPGTMMMLRLLVKSHRKQTDSFIPPEGIRLSREKIREVPCFVIEPAMEETLPCMLYCHGGAFYLPTQVTSLQLACVYAKEFGIRVVIPEYRLVPEHPAPAALEDCLRVWEALEERHTMLLYGESAGGALAAGLTLYLRDHGVKMPAGQMLIYPVLDHAPEKYPSMVTCADAAWTTRSNESMWQAYLKDTPDQWLPYLIPMKMEELGNLPAAYIEPQQIDVLRDEAAAYAKRLEQAQVDVELNLIDGSYHGFDGDLTSPLVQRVLRHRIEVMDAMLRK